MILFFFNAYIQAKFPRVLTAQTALLVRGPPPIPMTDTSVSFVDQEH